MYGGKPLSLAGGGRGSLDVSPSGTDSSWGGWDMAWFAKSMTSTSSMADPWWTCCVTELKVVPTAVTVKRLPS